jgi:hypothetical protein
MLDEARLIPDCQLSEEFEGSGIYLNHAACEWWLGIFRLQGLLGTRVRVFLACQIAFARVYGYKYPAAQHSFYTAACLPFASIVLDRTHGCMDESSPAMRLCS